MAYDRIYLMDEAALRAKMQQAVVLIASEISSIRTGRATPAMVEGVVVPAYGGTQRLKVNELATISANDPQSIVIDPWDKSIIGDIKKGILAANIGLTPNIDGGVIRISVPPMTTEDREKYVKILSGKVENGRVMIRQIRGEKMKAIKRRFENNEIPEDVRESEEKKLQEITDEHTRKIEQLGEAKKEELLKV